MSDRALKLLLGVVAVLLVRLLLKGEAVEDEEDAEAAAVMFKSSKM